MSMSFLVALAVEGATLIFEWPHTSGGIGLQTQIVPVICFSGAGAVQESN